MCSRGSVLLAVMWIWSVEEDFNLNCKWHKYILTNNVDMTVMFFIEYLSHCFEWLIPVYISKSLGLY